MRRHSLVAALVAVLAGITAACGGSSGARRAAAPVVRGAAPPITAHPATTVAPGDAKRRSQPYWVPVAAPAGTGAALTDPFAIDPHAIQWRVVAHCQGSFQAVAVRDSGEALPRPVVDTSSCGSEEKGFATETGSFRLKVTASGAWDAKVEQQVDTPLVEPPPAGGQVVSSFPVYGVDRQGEGVAKLYRLADGSHVIRLEDFYVTLNSDLEVRVSPLPEPKSTDQIAAAPYGEAGPLKATVGSMNQPVPGDVDLSQYHSIVIWCEITRNAYAAARLSPG